MASNHEDYVQACAKVGELIGLIVVSWLGTVPAVVASSKPKTVEATGAERLLKINEASDQCDVSPNTFKGYEKRGLVKRVPNLGVRTVRYRQSDIDRLKARIKMKE